MNPPKVLYHYCSTQAFHAIIENKQIRLSSLTLGNDTTEGKLVARAFARVARRHKLSESETLGVLTLLDGLEEVSEALALCLSEEGDLLSQWRGYAKDAMGVSIGFSSLYLQWISGSKGWGRFRLDRVSYDLEAHDSEVEPAYTKMVALTAEAPKGPPGMLDMRTKEEIARDDADARVLYERWGDPLSELFSKFFLLKSPAFREEREWRLLSHWTRDAEQVRMHRAFDDKLVPYRILELAELSRGPISEIVLGPKHVTPVNVVRNFLSQSGFGDVSVKQSEATYR